MLISGSSDYPYTGAIETEPQPNTSATYKNDHLINDYRGVPLDEEQQDVARIITELSNDYGVESDIALAIAWCESRFRGDAKNPNSSATGVYQFIDSTWQVYSGIYNQNNKILNRLNPTDNISLALQVISNKGVSDWASSVSCHNMT